MAVAVLFAISGFSRLVFSVLGVLSLTRYRAMILFVYVLLLLEHVARMWILLMNPIDRTGTPGFYVNLVILVQACAPFSKGQFFPVRPGGTGDTPEAEMSLLQSTGSSILNRCSKVSTRTLARMSGFLDLVLVQSLLHGTSLWRVALEAMA